MKNPGIYLAIVAAIALASGQSFAQEPPLIKPATPAPPSQPATQPAAPAANPPLTFIGQVLPPVNQYGLGTGPGSTGYVQPIFGFSSTLQQDIDYANGVASRATNLGNVGINTKKIADVLDRGFPNIAPPSSLSEQAKKKIADDKIQLAGGDPVEPGKVEPGKVGDNKIRTAGGGDAKEGGQNGQENGTRSEFKQTIDEMSKVFKMQADLIRSIDIGGTYRPSINGNGNRYNPDCPNGLCGPDGCAMVLSGRTGLQLAMLAPQSLDILNLPRNQGLYVKEVFPKTPAEAAGFKRNDVIVEFDGKKVPSNFIDFLTDVFNHVKNDVPINAVVLRAGQKVEIAGMKITDRRVIPALPNECPLDSMLPQIIQVVPGINSTQASTNRNRELRGVSRPGGITEFIWVDVPERK